MANIFRVAARTLRQLGAELITSDDVALNELIKNAFDARSPRVVVSINSTADIAALTLVGEQLQSGIIRTETALERVNKAISQDLSFEAKAELIQRFRDVVNNHVEFSNFLDEFRKEQSIIVTDTGRGMSKDDLENRFLVIGTPGKLYEKAGAVSSDKPILGEKGIGRLSMMRLGDHAIVKSKQPSGNWNEIDFNWTEFDNPSLYLDQVEVEVKESESFPKITQGTEIKIQGLNANWTPEKVELFINRYIRRLQNPFVVDKLPYPIDIYLNGKRIAIAALPSWLIECAQFTASIQFDPSGIDATPQILRRELTWRGSSSPEIRTWTMSDLTQQLSLPAEVFNNLGPLNANCLWFNRQRLNANDVERTVTDVKDQLNIWCGGFSVYRDSFRVGKTGGMDDDWLEWDSTSLKATGFALNRYQTIGSVSISSKKNQYLIDSANRERLISCPEHDLLKELLGNVLMQDLRSHIQTMREVEGKQSIARESTEESIRRSENSLKQTLSSLEEIGKVLPKEHKSKVVEIREALHGQIEYVKTIKNSLNMAKETKVELLELANIGLVVEMVIHELTRLTDRTGELLTELKDQKKDQDILKVVENLRTQISATNKRIRTVDAMSPAGRHRRERYDVLAQINSICAGFSNRFKRHDVKCEVLLDESDVKATLEVSMVHGLVAQVLENLLGNSLYWLQQGLRAGESERKIRIDVDSKALTISMSDNGPGIDPRNEKDIFMPYYSTRKKGKGLGLYIAAELVDYHGGNLYLNPLSDSDGRLRTFVIELPKEEK